MEIIFYRNKQKPDYFLLYKGKNGVDPQKMLHKLAHTGKFVNSGYVKVDIELGHILKTEQDSDFFHFLADDISSNHIPHQMYNDETFKAWYEFKEFKPNEWLKIFEDIHKAKTEPLVDTQHGTQITLF